MHNVKSFRSTLVSLALSQIGSTSDITTHLTVANSIQTHYKIQSDEETPSIVFKASIVRMDVSFRAVVYPHASVHL